MITRHAGALRVRTTLETAACTDVGNVRTLNEDSVAVAHPDQLGKSGKGTILVLADGLGGRNAGEVASKMVTTRLPELYFSSSEGNDVCDLISAVHTCNTIVHETSNTSKTLQGMGTTLVAALLVDDFVIVANVGDSRGYLFRDGSVIHRTKDHSLRDAGMHLSLVNVRNRFSHVLTRAIGPTPHVLVDITSHHVVPGDVILLCSDGLTDCVCDGDIEHIVLGHSPADAAQMLVSKAKEQGGEDNISVVVARVQSTPVMN